MSTNIVWPFLFVASLLIGDTVKMAPIRLQNKKISIVDCSNELYRKTGDTLWLTDIYTGDTLAFSFRVRPGSGFGWDVVHQQYLHIIRRRVSDSLTKGGDNPLRSYSFEFVVTRQDAFTIQFAYRRGEKDTPKTSCIIMPFRKGK
jgi:hypothetical protein